MPRVIVIHRDMAESASRASRLRANGIEAEPYLSLGTRGFRMIRAAPPDAIVIDLMQLPSYGRAIGALIRESKSLRTIPLVFIEGDPEKTAKVKATLPDAVFAPWTKIGPAIERAIRRAPAAPMMPVDASRPLLTKLGIKDGAGVALLHAPKDFALPKGAWKRATIEAASVIIAFYPNAASLGRELPTLAGMLRKGLRLWIAWPKRAGEGASDLSMPRVREMAQMYGMTDYKVCAIDEKWSGMVLGRRRG
ncbi:MAG TPA: hypothetical protein VKE70_21045 [Candidatus Solibacter sp.]|nr:hypothetical protein [Candidatus Solibacter sp.]